jgi:hypothetical protein
MVKRDGVDGHELVQVILVGAVVTGPSHHVERTRNLKLSDGRVTRNEIKNKRQKKRISIKRDTPNKRKQTKHEISIIAVPLSPRTTGSGIC